MPAYAFGAVGTAVNGAAGINPGAPAGVSVGNLLALPVVCRNNTDTINAISGWTQVAPHANVTWCDLWLRIADGTAADTPTGISSVGGNQCTAQIGFFTGNIYTDLPSIVDSSVDKNGSNVSVLYDTITPVRANCLVLAISGKNKTATSDGTSFNTLTSFTQAGTKVTNGTTVSLWWGYDIQTTSATVGPDTQTLAGTTETLQYDSIYIALKVGNPVGGAPFRRQGRRPIGLNGVRMF